MPSFSDSIFIFFLALLIFGPKKLPELARQLGKLMAEFRRASNEFRMQMEDELRLAEQADQQKKIAAMEAAAPVQIEGENTIAPPVDEEPIERHPHELPPEEFNTVPIATSGELNMMPPDTGLPVSNATAPEPVAEAAIEEAVPSVSSAFDSIPRVPDPETVTAGTAEPATEALHG